ncbi:MAG: NAD(P)/FAD-dependent oxidoreductase [Thermoanaerobaculia bacterium]
MAERPRVVIVGGGFGGILAAEGLARAPVDVVLIDRTNYHLFQPLLYQVATAHLAPGDIAAPIRQILARQRNAVVLLGEVTAVDLAARALTFVAPGLPAARMGFDFLILATGMAPSYFGHDEFAAYAPGLKSLGDATALRYRTLSAFERAEVETDETKRRELLSFVLVGAGPTGVEMAGALAELARETLAKEFRHFDPRSTRIVLLEAGPRILPTFDAALADRAAARLRKMEVEIRTGHPVEAVDEHGVTVAGSRIAAANVFWTAGVKPTPVAASLGAATDRLGRVLVGPDGSLPGHAEVFVIGDLAHFEQDGKPLPGVAQVAMQQGAHAARVIALRLAGRPAPPPFRYRDKGNLAVVGRNFALLERGRWKSSGFLAWLVWALVHIQFLALFHNKLLVLAQWGWTYLTRQRGSRLILGRP